MHIFQKHLTEAADQHDIKVRSYSGRFMYGKSCVAITGSHDECMKAIADAIIQARDADDGPDPERGMNFGQYVQRILAYSQDNMGLGTVIYWPRVEYTDVPYDGGCPDCGAPEMEDCCCDEDGVPT